MAGRSPEANYQSQFKNPEQVRNDIQIDPDLRGQQARPQLDFQESKWRKGARLTRNWNAATAVGWGAASTVFAPAAIMALIDGGTALGAHAVVVHEDKKAEQAQNEAQNVQGEQTQGDQQVPRTRREQPGFQASEHSANVLPFRRRTRRRTAQQAAAVNSNAA